MEILDNGFIKLGVSSIIKASKIQAIKPLGLSKDLQILLIIDGVAFTVQYNRYSDYKANKQERDEEFVKLTSLLTTKQKKRIIECDNV